jgi:hypothetical protein
MIRLGKALVDELTELAKSSIEQSQGDKAGQFKAEYINKRVDIEAIAKSRSKFPTNHCYERLQQDLKSFIGHHQS